MSYYIVNISHVNIKFPLFKATDVFHYHRRQQMFHNRPCRAQNTFRQNGLFLVEISRTWQESLKAGADRSLPHPPNTINNHLDIRYISGHQTPVSHIHDPQRILEEFSWKRWWRKWQVTTPPMFHTGPIELLRCAGHPASLNGRFTCPIQPYEWNWPQRAGQTPAISITEEVPTLIRSGISNVRPTWK